MAGRSAMMPRARDEPLITECPSCHTRFRVSDAQLQRARGKVRCGACLNVFDGVAHLTLASLKSDADPDAALLGLDALLEELARPLREEEAEGPAETVALEALLPPRRPPGRAPLFGGYEDPDPARESPAGPAPAPATRSPLANIALDRTESPIDLPALVAAVRGETAPGSGSSEPDLHGKAAAAAAPADAPLPTSAGAVIVAPPPDLPPRPAVTIAPAPDATEQVVIPATEPEAASGFGAPRRRRRTWMWLALPVGCLLLAAQVVWYQFDEWSKDPAWRGFYQSACGLLGCELPIQQDTSLLVTRNMAVRSDPDEPGMLRVRAVIINEAPFAQPFPVLDLRFTTLRGILVAGRRYRPEEYLAGDAAGMTLMPSKTPVQVELSIDDPGPEAVNYFLRLR